MTSQKLKITSKNWFSFYWFSYSSEIFKKIKGSKFWGRDFSSSFSFLIIFDDSLNKIFNGFLIILRLFWKKISVTFSRFFELFNLKILFFGSKYRMVAGFYVNPHLCTHTIGKRAGFPSWIKLYHQIVWRETLRSNI